MHHPTSSTTPSSSSTHHVQHPSSSNIQQSTEKQQHHHQFNGLSMYPDTSPHLLSGPSSMLSSSADDASQAADSPEQRKQPPHKKRRYKAQMSETSHDIYYCLVCGDRALGYNFDAMTCESCKAFFRRNAGKDDTKEIKFLKCNFSGHCDITVNTRKFCSACRLKKCVEVGMKKDWILNDDQLKARREKTRVNRVKREQQHHHMSIVTNGRKRMVSYENDSACSSLPSGSPPPLTPKLCLTCLTHPDQVPQWTDRRPLTIEEREVLDSIRDSLVNVMNGVDANDHRDIQQKANQSEQSIMTAYAVTNSFIYRLIAFVRTLRDFSALDRDDKVALVKGGIYHCILMRGVIIYDTASDAWSFKSAKLEGAVHSVPTAFLKNALGQVPCGPELAYRYCKFMKEYHTIVNGDQMALTLLLIIEFFNPNRANLNARGLVDRLNEKYLMLLKRYLQSQSEYQLSQRTFSEAVFKLNELQTIVDRFCQLIQDINFANLEPLLQEVFDRHNLGNKASKEDHTVADSSSQMQQQFPSVDVERAAPTPQQQSVNLSYLNGIISNGWAAAMFENSGGSYQFKREPH